MKQKDAISLDAGYSIGEETFAFLKELFCERNYRTMIEFGSGASTIRFAQELPLEKFATVEHDWNWVNRTKRQLQEQGLADKVKVVFAPVALLNFAGVWEYMSCNITEKDWWIGQVDLVVVDGPTGAVSPTTRGSALHWVAPFLHAGSTIVLDDAKREGERQVLKQWANAFPYLEQQVLDVGHGIAVLRRK